MAKRKSNSRTQRWSDACGDLQCALADLRMLVDQDEDGNDTVDWKSVSLGHFEEAAGALHSIWEEYSEWNDNLPENLQGNSPVSDKLEELCYESPEDNLDTYSLQSAMDDENADDFVSALDELEGYVDEWESKDLPLGFGRD